MTSLKFGTSGLRGLAIELAGLETQRYVTAFLRHLVAQGQPMTALYVGRDMRASSAAIAADCATAALGFGLRVVDCGALPAPALACHAIAAGAPSIMVTGSHIPADRNGLKFFRADGEISKGDEAGILAQTTEGTLEGSAGAVRDESTAAATRYRERYRGVLAPDALNGRRIGVFEHSTVGREPLAAIFAGFGAEIVLLGRVDDFIAVDTEAFSDAVFAPLPGWIAEHQLDAVISADGDADRPLLMDDCGKFVRGDVLGLLAAQFFGADTVVTPVTSNSAIEATGFFPSVVRTRVGSPYVIEAMQAAIVAGGRCVIGFEANGGTLLGSDLMIGEKHILALPTRDAVLPLIGVLGQAAARKSAISDLVGALPLRVALSDRLTNVASEQSRKLLEKLSAPTNANAYFAERGAIARLAAIDGLQFFLDDGTMIHYRASGNAPELRCYVEAANATLAADSLDWGLTKAQKAMANG